MHFLLIILLAVGPCHSFIGFTASPTFLSASVRRHQPWNKLRLSTSSTDSQNTTEDSNSIVGVAAPLQYMGPYPCLALHFPKLADTQSTSIHNQTQTGITLTFVLDTGANVNAIDVKLAEKLALPLVATSNDVIGSAGVGGTQRPGDIVALGDCRLHGLPPEQTSTFMTNLTAAALEHSSPIGHGILGINFFSSFPAGVEFDWYGTDGDPPTIIFYYGKELPNIDIVRKGLIRVPLQRLAVQILSLMVNVNGTDMLALLDTGSPITVLNPQAAQLAGIETVAERHDASEYPTHKQQQHHHQPNHPQAYGDDTLRIGGVDGVPLNLYRSVSTCVPLRVGPVPLGEGPVYVGNLPGLIMAGKISGSSLPSVVLGLDAIRRAYRMVLRAPDNEVWFEELHDQKRYTSKV